MLTLPILVLDRWKLVRLMAERMTNITVSVLWRYLEYMRMRMHLSLGRSHVIEYSVIDTTRPALYVFV